MLVHIYVLATSMFLGLQGSGAVTPQSAVEALLDADRHFSSAGADKTVVESLSAMFAEDVMLPGPGAVFTNGKDKAIDALKSTSNNLTSRVSWAPIRGGISADGTHGFTFGYMTMTSAEGKTQPWKYLSYWVKGPEGWRVAAYRRRPRPEGSVTAAMMDPSLPARMAPPSADTARIDEFSTGLAAAEKAFSDEAQRVGLGAAFTKFGRGDAINLGGPQDIGFVVGAEAIGRSVGEGAPTDRSEVEWSADRVLIASSGDLGITFGMIRFHTPREGQPPAVPFFTIWRRDDLSSPWRYIAE